MGLQTIRIRHLNAVVVASTVATSIGVTDWACYTGEIAVQVTGSAQHIAIRVERSALDPDGPDGANPAPADGVGIEIEGSPVGGIAPVMYMEPGVGWWRLVVTELVGGSALLTTSGHYGGDNGNLPGAQSV